jgi:hypothetical protein
MDQLREPLPMNFDDDEEDEEHAIRILQNEPSEGRPIETINGLNLDTITVNRRNRLQQYNHQFENQLRDTGNLVNSHLMGDHMPPLGTNEHDLQSEDDVNAVIIDDVHGRAGY